MKKLRNFFMLLVALLALAGCGGGTEDSGIDRSFLESQIESDANLKLMAEGGGTTNVSCVENGDEQHYDCYVTVAGNPVLTSYSLAVTCDDTGYCVWRPT